MLRIRTLLLCLPLLLSACAGYEKESTLLGEEHESIFSEKTPGLSEFDTISKHDREDEKWWGSFYGHSKDSAD